MSSSKSLLNRGFCSLLSTQFLGAANDNILKQVVTLMVATGIWKDQGLGAGGQALPTILLAVPFIFFSGLGGQLADRFSKRTVMLGVKVAEVPIVLLAFVGLWSHSLWLTLVALLLLAIQSSFFGPAKFGCVPELVGEDNLSQANGVLNMLSNLAVIIGSLVAGPLSDMFDPQADNSLGVSEPVTWAPGAALLGVAVLGLGSILLMPRLAAVNPKTRITLNPFGAYLQCFREMGPALLTVTLAWAGFYMVGTIALLVIAEYQQILDIDYSKTTMLMGVLGIAVALGSVTTGLLSGSHIRPKLIPIGAVGMAACFVMLGTFTPEYYSVGALIGIAGFAAGFYIIPLQALLQYLSPEGERGRFLGTANAVSFALVISGALVFWGCSQFMEPNRIFLVTAALAVLGTIAGTIQMRRIMRDMETHEQQEDEPESSAAADIQAPDEA